MNYDKYKVFFDEKYSYIINKFLDNSNVADAIKYSSLNSGKRLRPYIMHEVGCAFGCDLKKLFAFETAIELIHNYSLVHDDMPCMDNDDYRRGKESTHKKFGQNIALLCGDAMLNLSVEILTSLNKNTDMAYNTAMMYLYKMSGNSGMIKGQEMDLYLQNNDVFYCYDEYLKMIIRKTGRLFNAAFVIPLILLERPKSEIKDIVKISNAFSILFQIVDDLKDKTENKTIEKSNILNILCEEEINSKLKKISAYIDYKLKNNEFLHKSKIGEIKDYCLKN